MVSQQPVIIKTILPDILIKVLHLKKLKIEMLLDNGFQVFNKSGKECSYWINLISVRGYDLAQLLFS